ncbi:MAG: ABC transporter ATP-binding protein [Flavobacteriales bacterium]|nr:ATP-binding cassette domain-containing protein [Flavobacteriales bacterium]MCB9165888.1 ABC transporter ATP-binding protein [Flavobacteriales bacterium]MCB9194560.1 ABC transporter ATP-binding protein [Flavobacteriales bacterium]
MLRLEGITKTYGAFTALDCVSLEVPDGAVFGLLGPNGAGKTSLIRIITRIAMRDSGTVLFDGRPMTDADVARIGYLPEERGLYKKMKVGEQAVYLAQLKGMSKQEARLRSIAWFERWDMSGWWGKKVEELSKGMAQKVQFITTVLHGPKLLILDEPFSGFDPINADLVRTEILRLRDEGTTVMLSTHNMGSVEQLCDHIALIDRSHKVLDGRVRDIQRAYGTNIYRVTFSGQLIGFTHALWTGAELLDHTVEDERIEARVRLMQGTSVNDLLTAVMPHVRIHGVREEVPTMHEVFIRAVGGDTPGREAEGPTE